MSHLIEKKIAYKYALILGGKKGLLNLFIKFTKNRNFYFISVIIKLIDNRIRNRKNIKKLKKIYSNRNKMLKLHEQHINKIQVSNFTIISSNCWGGAVYEDLKMQYLTPTVGLFLFAPCFIFMLKDLKFYMNCKLNFINKSKYPEANIYIEAFGNYPIGLLNQNIEIHFLHYKNEQEAFEKWERRKMRINWDNLFISCTDRDNMTLELMKQYDELPFEKKVLFTAINYPNIKSAHKIKTYKNNNYVGDLYNERYTVTSSFDLKEWLNRR